MLKVTQVDVDETTTSIVFTMPKDNIPRNEIDVIIKEFLELFPADEVNDGRTTDSK